VISRAMVLETVNDHRNAHLQNQAGRRADFLEVFRSRSTPAHVEIGMKYWVRSSPSRIPTLFLCVVYLTLCLASR
jgi:hypothetical protein